MGLIRSHLVGSVPREFLEFALSLLCEQYNLNQTTDFISVSARLSCQVRFCPNHDELRLIFICILEFMNAEYELYDFYNFHYVFP